MSWGGYIPGGLLRRRRCVWPDCLTAAEADELAADIVSESETGRSAPPRPDKRRECGCPTE